MKTIQAFPHPIQEIEHCWIPLKGGERLSARLWLPADATATPVPAILEYIPYRKRDYSAVRDHTTHAYLAGHGYACVRVDVRGSGDSDGLHEEQWGRAYDEDALEVFRWIAAQPWSNGTVGMMGLSWGGQACLRMARLGAPELKAVIALSAADDRYTNKYLGGCLLLNSVVWGYTMVGQNSRPPDPATAGESWRALWLHRLENTVRYVENWVAHPRWDAYWASGSVIDAYKRFTCPVYTIGGAADPGYAATVPRLLAHLTVPTKGLIGPWAHKYPHYAMPGPAIGFLQEALRWFDRWLKGVDNGIDQEPRFRVWMHEAMAPAPYHKERKGRWVEEPTWPSPNVKPLTFRLNPGTLEPRARRKAALKIKTPQTVGLAGGEWMPWLVFGEQAELPFDQREDDARSLVFDSEPLTKRLEILGAPKVELEVASDKPVAAVVVRLCSVAPDGVSERVTYGALNLTRRHGLKTAKALSPGRRYRVEVPMYDIGYAFSVGHRIRLAISTTYWPVLWPAPEEATLTLFTGASRLTLPVRRPRPQDRRVKPFPPAEAAPPMARTVIEPPTLSRTIRRDLASGRVTLSHLDDGGVYRIDAYQLECGARTERRLTIADGQPLSARVEVDWTWSFRRGDWRARTETKGRVWCTRDTFEFETTVDAFEGDSAVFSRSWRNSLPRDLM